MKSQNLRAVGPPRSPAISEEEWQVRVDLAACHRLAALYGYDDIVWNHISARIPDDSDGFLINHFGLRFDEVTASNLVALDSSGNVVEPARLADGTQLEVEDTNVTGFVIHSAIYNHRADVNCVMHTHSRAGLAVSALAEGFVPLTQDGFQFYGKVAYHDYEGLSLDLDERERLAASLGDDNTVMIMRNHGLMSVGATVAQAFVRMHYLELACRTQIDAFATGREIQLPPENVRERAVRQYEFSAPAGTYEWDALLRKLDDIDPSYRD